METHSKFRHRLSVETLSRLPSYRGQLMALLATGTAVVSSRELAEKLGVGDAQLRRDLSYLGLLGRPGLGYQVGTVLERVNDALGLDREWSLAIVGFGALGTALARYEGFNRHHMEVAAVFDANPTKIGKKVGNTVVSSMDEAKAVVAEKKIDIAVIAVPGNQAQAAVDRMIEAGIKAFLNFAPAALSVPGGIIVRGVDISSELQILTHLITSGEE